MNESAISLLLWIALHMLCAPFMHAVLACRVCESESYIRSLMMNFSFHWMVVVVQFSVSNGQETAGRSKNTNSQHTVSPMFEATPYHALYLHQLAPHTKPKLEILKRIVELGEWLECARVVRRVDRRMMRKLRGGTAGFQIEMGRWRGVTKQERVCKECDSGEVEDVEHWLMRCEAWKSQR